VMLVIKKFEQVTVNDVPRSRPLQTGGGSLALSSIFKSTSADNFLNLPPKGNAVIKGRPNHMFLHPQYLVPKVKQSKYTGSRHY
jgi:hypothetical protein